MSRTCIPFSTGDIAALARSLNEQLVHHDGLPGHVALLNMLARAVGYRNFQSFRAQSDTSLRPAQEPVDPAQLKKAARYFHPNGSLVNWPSKPVLQAACLWVLWSKLPPRQNLTEDDLNRRLRAAHQFGDHALLRRELCERGLVQRTADGRQYRRVERRPSAADAALIRLVTANGRPS